MEISLDDFRRHFELLSDAALLSTDRDDLVAGARACYDEEVEKRGLNAPPEDRNAGNAGNAGNAAEEAADAEQAEAGELVLVATFSVAEEASLARGLLEIAGIPWSLQSQYLSLSGYQMRLMVPAAFEEQALEVLESEISEDDLAAQAEAAAMSEEEPEEDPQEWPEDEPKSD